jgi:predicted MPP superfamily phosphohydrolase
MSMRYRIAVFVAVFQVVMLAGHAFLYETWKFFRPVAPGPGVSPLAWVTAILSVSFVAASLLAFRYHNRVVRWFYKVAAVWLGAASFFLFAAGACWVVYGVAWLAGLGLNRTLLVGILYGAAALVSVFGVINAVSTRVRRIRVKLPNLPESWRGRTAALVSDLHLGHVWSSGFVRRVVRMIGKLKPATVWISGDLFDGTAVDAEFVAAPLRDLKAPLGTYFVEGNHEEFRDPRKYLNAIRAAGVFVLENEKTEVDGLQIVGVPYRHATHAGHFRSVLEKIGVDRGRASVLLTHAPDQVGVAEAAGIGLQVSGHTHLGQFVPWTWIARRIYRDFVYGLNRVGKMLVYTSSGAGTWGPPLRVGSNPEIVLIEFE